MKHRKLTERQSMRAFLSASVGDPEFLICHDSACVIRGKHDLRLSLSKKTIFSTELKLTF